MYKYDGSCVSLTWLRPKKKSLLYKVIPWSSYPHFIVMYAKELYLYLHYLECIINTTLHNNNGYKYKTSNCINVQYLLGNSLIWFMNTL